VLIIVGAGPADYLLHSALIRVGFQADYF